ncbi:hypothetical protein [Sphingomonas sp. T9W2]|uniref:hypothetical protein n=1 Tax=Sphingomonas sp. T9W2 TaxID=3143183 RepID=UPI0031F52641
MKRCLLFVACAIVAAPAHAQLTAPVRNGDTTITVTGRSTTGQKVDGKKVEMSAWRMAETPHVAVFSQGDEARLRATAHNLEKLHFLLSALLGRVDQPDDTIKISVTIIGDAAEFEQLRLTDSRWQYGPYPHEFAQTIYYDPRPEGPVLATTETDLNLILQPSRGRPSSRNCSAGEDSPLVDNFPIVRPDPIANGETAEYLSQFPANEIVVCQSANSRLYAGFAQNYLMTYFPAAYPRWFVQGFGELFSTIAAGETSIDYGRRPEGFFKVMDRFGDYPIKHVFDGRYLTGEGRAWTPYHAWRMVHFLYFSDTWKPRLEQYLAAVAAGADPKRAASVFGKPADLQRAVMLFRGSKAPFDRVTFPADRIPEPTIRRLTRAEAGLIRGRLEMGARIDVPDSGPNRDAALARRTAWLERLRGNATRFPDLIENQLLLAEAECRAGNPTECLSAADRALAQSPAEPNTMVWKGTALTQLAMRAPAGERRQRLEEARGYIVKANRQDPDGILPLIAYYNSFAVAGDRATDVAVGGLYKVVQAVPAAPEPRLKLGEELVARDIDDEARSTLLPVAKGPFETPEQAAAAALLPKVSGR